MMRSFTHSIRGPLLSIGLLVSLAALCGCGRSKEDQARTVTSFDFASCNSLVTTDGTQLEAIKAFKGEVQDKYFVRQRNSAFAANHEGSASESGVREYEGPFYFYVHPRQPEKKELAQGVDWAAMVFMHASKVRARTNGQEWSEWKSVRTRNFAQAGRTVDGLGRWKCLLGAEIAWANVTRSQGAWTVTPVGVSVYDEDEIRRALPTPAKTQIEGTEAVEVLADAR
jgi:hypothetical protein